MLIKCKSNKLNIFVIINICKLVFVTFGRIGTWAPTCALHKMFIFNDFCRFPCTKSAIGIYSWWHSHFVRTFGPGCKEYFLWNIQWIEKNPSIIRDRCYDFLNIFAKRSAKKSAFFTQNNAKLFKNWIITLVFEKNANFLTENCQKSHKIVIITSTPV
jgi:hypothetical protein